MTPSRHHAASVGVIHNRDGAGKKAGSPYDRNTERSHFPMYLSWQLRRAEISDCTAIARHRYFDTRATAQDIENYIVWLRGAIMDERYIGVLAESRTGVIAGAGMVVLDWGPTRNSPSAHRGRIVKVYCDPDFREQGVANALVTSLLGIGDNSAITTISLAATSDSVGLYQRLGFCPYSAEMIRVK